MGASEFAAGSKHFRLGDRVRVSKTHHWAKGATGTVAHPNEQVRRVYGDWHGLAHEVKSVMGIIRCYWVQFDHAHLDAQGHGPYQEGGIDSRFMEHVSAKD
jgi:hypothetical protein